MKKIISTILFLMICASFANANEQLGASVGFTSGGPSGSIVLVCASKDCTEVAIQSLSEIGYRTGSKMSISQFPNNDQMKEMLKDYDKRSKSKSDSTLVIEAMNAMTSTARKGQDIYVNGDTWNLVLKMLSAIENNIPMYVN